MNSKSIPFLFFVFVFLFVQAGASNPKLDFEKALLLEEASGKLQQAIALYKKVVSETTDQALAARAQLHVGMCYEKLGRQEAKRAYQVVVERYPAQSEIVGQARQRLARLSPDQAGGNALSIREFMRNAPYKAGVIAAPTNDVAEFTTTSDGQTFVYTDWNTGDLVTKNFSTGKTEGLYKVDWSTSTEFFMAPVLSPDDRKVAYVHYSWPDDKDIVRLVVDSIQGKRREILYEHPEFGIPYDWSTDGANLLVTLVPSGGPLQLATFDVREKKMRPLATLGHDHPQRAQFSPDGRWVAYDCVREGERRVYLLEIEGLKERVLIDSPGQDDSPLWSRDGRFLMFRSSRSGEWDLMALPIIRGQVAGEPFLIKSNVGAGSFLRSMTSDGRLFYGEQMGGPEVVVVDRPASSQRLGPFKVLPKIQTRVARDPYFSPDGKYLVYVTGGYPMVGTHALQLVDADGASIRRISFAPEYRNLRRPVVSPDGRSIAVLSQDRQRQGQILLVSAETGSLSKTFAIGAASTMNSTRIAGWSSDSHLLYLQVKVNEPPSASLETIDVQTGDRKSAPLPSRVDGNGAKVSPDGKYLVFAVLEKRQAGQEIGRDLVVRTLSDGTERILKTNVRKGGSLRIWDSDSRHIFYRTNKQLHRCSIETGVDEIFLRDTGDLMLLHHVSSDGRRLAFQKEGQDSRIWVVENFLPPAK